MTRPTCTRLRWLTSERLSCPISQLQSNKSKSGPLSKRISFRLAKIKTQCQQTSFPRTTAHNQLDASWQASGMTCRTESKRSLKVFMWLRIPEPAKPRLLKRPWSPTALNTKTSTYFWGRKQEDATSTESCKMTSLRSKPNQGSTPIKCNQESLNI